MKTLAWIPAWQSSDVEIKEDNLIYEGFYKVKKLRLRHKCFSGEWSPWVVREQVCRTNAAAVLLWDPQQDKVVLIEQLRIGLVGQDTEVSPWLLENVAGLIDPGESPEQTALREAQEEAGYTIKELLKIGDYYPTPGGFSEMLSVFCGIIDVQDEGGIQGNAHEHEDIKVHVFSTRTILTALEKGHLRTSASTVIALQWLANKIRNNHGKTSL